MPPSKLDQIYRSILLSKYFTEGWGKPEIIKRICEFRKIVSNRETCYKLVPSDYPVFIEKEVDCGYYKVINGYFLSPFAHYLPEVVPKECQIAHFQFVLPKTWKSQTFKPIMLHIAGTGDQFFWRRRNLLAKPLIKEAGIGSIILENPFYGRRKPLYQIRSILNNVSDIFVMGGCLILESLALFNFCERLGYGPLGVTGLSMGGHMASLIATCWPKPLTVVPCLSGLTASDVFTQGVISRALNWDMLEKQFSSADFRKQLDKDAFKAGQLFVRNITEEVENKNFPFGNCRRKSLCYCSTSTGGNAKFPPPSVSITAVNDWRRNNFCFTDVLLAEKRSSSSSSSSSLLADQRKCALSLYKNVCDNLTEPEPEVECNYFSKKKKKKTTKWQLTDDDDDDDECCGIKGNSENMIHVECGTGTHNTVVNGETENKMIALAARFARRKTIVSSSTAAAAEDGWKDQQALNFMNGIMDECTHLKNYPVPVDTSLVIAVYAVDDAYVPLPSKQERNLREIWPEAEIRLVNGGHVQAYIQSQKEFRVAIIDSFSRYRSKYMAVAAER